MERAKLRGRIVEKYGTLTHFAEAIGAKPATVSAALAGKSFKLDTATKWAAALDIPENDIFLFFW